MIRYFFTFLLVAVVVPLSYGKMSPDLIKVSGGGLTEAIEITDSTALKTFDPWTGRFADWQKKALVDAPCYRRSFEVSFYIKSPDKKIWSDPSRLRMIYGTRYCFDGVTGYVYIPGPGEALYRENAATIVRGDADGKWHPATAEWNALLSGTVSTRDEQAMPDMMQISGGDLKQPIQITEPDLLRTYSPWVGRFVDWKRPAAMGHCSWEYEITYFKRGIISTTPYDQDDLKMIYGIRYCLGDDAEPGYVHLAGRTDRFGDENIHTVWDGTQAGKWHPSTAEWKTFITHEVVDQRRSLGSVSTTDSQQ
jgi:hypothetical protein